MAWDKIHKTVNSDGGVTMTTGYLSETITLGNDADASTSVLDYPVKSDITMLVKFSGDIGADTFVQVEHSWDGSTWIKQGQFEEDASVDHDDLSKDMAKIAGIDDSLNVEANGMMMLYDIDSHGMANYTRFTVKANGTNESSKTATFYLFPHF
jgi:hypothetical protein|tara:strand:- start:5 stop:463 length:459 start_codon:yes stop_codon:yes gene_type:complete